jgi:hypothetical protein
MLHNLSLKRDRESHAAPQLRVRSMDVMVMRLKRSDFDKDRLNTAGRLKVDKNFRPCPVCDGDELYPNGIYIFNITKMLEHIKNNPSEFDLVRINVADFPKQFSSINEMHVDSVDVSRPVLLAEISPGRYNLIDGNHRVEKARKIGKNHLLAYKLSVKQQIRFLTEKKAYISYVMYWNEKLNV